MLGAGALRGEAGESGGDPSAGLDVEDEFVVLGQGSCVVGDGGDGEGMGG